MQRFITSRRVLVSASVLLFMLVASLSLNSFINRASAAPDLVSINGSYTGAPADAHLLGHHASKQITVMVVLQPRHVVQLNSLLAALYNPGSSRYHQWLARGAFDARFAPLGGVNLELPRREPAREPPRFD